MQWLWFCTTSLSPVWLISRLMSMCRRRSRGESAALVSPTTGPPTTAEPHLRTIAGHDEPALQDDQNDWNRTRSNNGDNFRDVVLYFRRLHSRESLPTATASGTEESANPQHPFSYYREFFVEEKCLGSGAFGAVYLVSHVVASHMLGWYAVKKMPAVDTFQLSAVIGEVRALQSIPQHENVVR